MRGKNLLRKHAEGKDVKNHYDSCKDLAVSFIRAYIVEAACQYLDLPNTDTVPENLPDHNNMTNNEIKCWMTSLVDPLVSNIVADSRRHISNQDIVNETDAIHSYGKVVLEIGLIFLELCDIVKSPSRIRLLCHMKYIMLVLKGHKNNSKYALEILRLLCQQFALLSERTANESLYGLFVNTDKTIIPAGLQMEHIVRLTKGHLRSMCSNVTDTSMVKRSSAFFGMEEISKNFDKRTGVVQRVQKHKKLSSYEDEIQIIKDLRQIKPFRMVCGRQSESLRKVPKNPIRKLDMANILKWILRHKMLLYYEL